MSTKTYTTLVDTRNIALWFLGGKIGVLIAIYATHTLKAPFKGPLRVSAFIDIWVK